MRRSKDNFHGVKMICLMERQPSNAIYLADEFTCSYILVHTPAFVQFGLRDLQNSVAAL